MEFNEMIDKLGELKIAYQKAKHEVRMQYVNEHAKFKVGDFIGNITGTIKVESVSYEWIKRWSEFNIVYYGYRYKKVKGEFVLCKDQKYRPLFREKDSHIKK